MRLLQVCRLLQQELLVQHPDRHGAPASAPQLLGVLPVSCHIHTPLWRLALGDVSTPSTAPNPEDSSWQINGWCWGTTAQPLASVQGDSQVLYSAKCPARLDWASDTASLFAFPLPCCTSFTSDLHKNCHFMLCFWGSLPMRLPLPFFGGFMASLFTWPEHLPFHLPFYPVPRTGQGTIPLCLYAGPKWWEDHCAKTMPSMIHPRTPPAALDECLLSQSNTSDPRGLTIPLYSS